MTLATLVVAAGPVLAQAAAWVDISPPQRPNPLRISLVDANSQRIFLGTAGAGLFKTTDGGATWVQNYDDFFIRDGIASTTVVQVVLDDNGEQGVALTMSGAYGSLDGGATWQRHPANARAACPASGFLLVPTPDGTGVMASELASSGPGGAVWVYEWASESWYVANDMLLRWPGASSLGLAFDVSDPPALYLGNTVRNFWSPDLGKHTYANSGGMPGDNNVRIFLPDPVFPRRVLAVNENRLYLQTTVGHDWIPYGEPLPAVIWALIHHPKDPDRMFAATDTGVLESRDRGLTWTGMTTAGLPFLSVIDLKIHASAPDRLLAAVAGRDGVSGGLFSLRLVGSTAIGEDDAGPEAVRGPEAVVSPNPASGRIGIRVEPAAGRTGRDLNIRVFDLRGHLVREIRGSESGARDGWLEWDTRDAAGAQVAAGVYELLIDAGAGQATRKRVTVCR